MTQRKVLEQRLTTLLQEKEPLDEYQQDEVVETMATLQSYHDIFWTRAFSFLSLCLSLGFMADAVHQVFFPFQMKHRGLWAPYLSSAALIVCELAFGVCLLFCFIAVFLRSRQRTNGFMWTPMSLTVICCSFFSFYMTTTAISESRNLNQTWMRADLLWMPVLPTLYCVMIYYIISLLDRSYKDVEKLKQRKYAFKAI